MNTSRSRNSHSFTASSTVMGRIANGFLRAHQVSFGGARHRRKLVHDDRDGGRGSGSDGNLQLGFGFHRLLPGLVLRLASGGATAAIVLQRLRLDVLQGLVDGNQHVGGLRQSDQADRDGA